MSNNTGNIEQYEYQTEMKQLLHLIIHSLYTHKEVFLRELISNASDALNKLRVAKLTDTALAAGDEELKISIELDKEKKSFAIIDNGIGMTKEELIKNIGTIANSGTLEFLKHNKNKAGELKNELIGQFGVGFYSVFMVCDEVTIETKSALAESKAYRWQSKGEGTFSIEEIEKEGVGTKIMFSLKEDSTEYADEFTVKNIINKYSNFADFPIYLNKEKVNAVSALWRKSSSEIKDEELTEFYKFISNDFEAPLGHLHLVIEGSVVNFRALLFIPRTAPFDLLRNPEQKGMHLYSNKILIQNDCKDLLPQYLSFVRGVVDTIDLPLNVSREVTQASPLMSKIQNILVSKILSLLSNWAKTEPEKYRNFYKNFGKLLETGLNSDFNNREKIIELLRYESSKTLKDEFVSLNDYVKRMQDGQKDIYYLTGETRETLEVSPKLEYFKKKDIEVFFLYDPIDIFTFPSIGEYDKKKVVSIEKSDIDLGDDSKIEKPKDNLSKDVLSLFKQYLSDDVSDVIVSKRLVDSPAMLVVGKDGLDPQMEKMMKMMNKNHVASKKILEINLEHPLLKNIARLYLANNNDPLIEKCIKQIYDGAKFIDGDLSDVNAFVRRMTELMQEATSK